MYNSNAYGALMQPQQQRMGNMRPQPGAPAPTGGAMPYQSRVQYRPLDQLKPLPEAPAKSDGGGGGMLGGMLGGMMSDVHSKTEIKRLESANDALTSALSQRPDYANTSAPSSGLQALGQQANPSQASFPDTPAANTVAAQNTALAPAAAPQRPAMPQPGQSDVRAPWGVNMGTPDLSELDAAYKRIGASQGPT